MTAFTHADTLHRLVKQVLDSGAAASLAEAETMFRSYRLSFAIGELEALRPIHQAALLTGVALGAAGLLGWRFCDRCPRRAARHSLATRYNTCRSRRKTRRSLSPPEINSPTVFIGGEPQPRSDGFHIRTTFAGWRGGIVPAYAARTLADDEAMPLAPMLAAALAVNEAFLFARQETPAAGRRMLGLSLWRPDPRSDWLAARARMNLRYAFSHHASG